MEDLKLLKNFPSVEQAQLAKNLLAEHGISSMMQMGNTAAGTEFTGAGDADLFVKNNDYGKAREIILALNIT